MIIFSCHRTKQEGRGEKQGGGGEGVGIDEKRDKFHWTSAVKE